MARVLNNARGVRSPMKEGTLVGRLPGTGTGAAKIIGLPDLVQSLQANGAIPTSAGAFLPSIADKRILANISGSTALPSANTLTAILDAILGSTKGMIAYRDASAWQALAIGADGKVLTASGGIPSWASSSGGNPIGPNMGTWSASVFYPKGAVVRHKAGYYIKVT